MKGKSRLLSLMLAFVLAIPSSIVAFAQDSTQNLSEALMNAAEGETIVLSKDTKETIVSIPENVTLDLNGYTLESTYVTCFGNLVDMSEDNTGLLKVSANRFLIQQNNKQLPVKIEEGYHFFDVTKFNAVYREEYAQYAFQPFIEKSAHKLISRGAAESGVTINVRCEWSQLEGERSQKFVYNDDYVKQFLDSYYLSGTTEKYGKMFTLALKGTEGLGDLTFQVEILSDTGVVIKSTAIEAQDKSSAEVTVDENGQLTEEVTLSTSGTTAVIAPGTKLNEGVTKLTLTTKEKGKTDSDITLEKNEELLPLDVHVEGIAADNTVPVIVTLKKAAPEYLNQGNISLHHVENDETVTMTRVYDLTDVDAHNEFYYEKLTGTVYIAMSTFSEVAIVSDTENAWNGNFDYSWYTDNTARSEEVHYTICNADQLAAFGAIVGGMNGQAQDSFAGKTVKLLANINLGDKDNANGSLIFHPIGYYYTDDKNADGTKGDYYSTVKSFEGTFDGNGHKISNFYQNTWEIKGDYDGNYYSDAMGLFGYVVNGTVKNLTIDSFSSDGEFTPTGCVAAYAVNSTFENIALTNCNPRVYNTGNGGIVGIGGNSDDPDAYKLTFTNITIDNTNKITALWGSWDVACGGLVGMFRGAGHAYMTNCHVAAQIDVYNDVCGNYQYYWYRYAGMMIGTNKNMITDANGYTVPETDKFHAENCTVHFGDWNDYYYCELVANSLASYTHDHQFSRLEQVDSVDATNMTVTLDGKTTAIPTSGRYNYVVVNGEASTENATCYHFVNGKVWNHEDAGEETVDVDGDGVKETVLKEDRQHYYLPFNQLFTGYGWGVKHIPIYDDGKTYFEGITILARDVADSVVKFKTKFNGDFLYRVGNANAVSLGTLFEDAKTIEINSSNIYVSIEKIYGNSDVTGEYTANTADWTKGTIKFAGTGVVKVIIQDYNYCKPTELILEVVDAVNATVATSATANNVVLLNDISGGFTVSGRYAVYGNGFTCTYTGNGQYLNNGLKQGVITVSENGTLDNLRIKASIYPSPYLYYGTNSFGEAVQDGPSSVEGDKTRYHYQLSAVAAKDNATISNCYIYGGRNNIFVNTGDVTITDSILECGVVANVQIQSNSSHTVTFNNVTTIQHQVNPTLGDTAKVMLGAGVLVGPETNDNPTIILNGYFKQYNWVNADDKNAVSDTMAQAIIQGALDATAYNHMINGKTASNLGIIYMNTYPAVVEDNTKLPYVLDGITMKFAGNDVSGQVCSVKNATAEQIYSDIENADRGTVNGYYKPQFKYPADLGGQYIAKTDDGDEFCYREGDTIYIMFPSGDSKELDLAALVNIVKYSGQNLNLVITCKDENGNTVAVSDGKIMLSAAGTYTVTYTVTDTLFFDHNGEQVLESIKYSWDVTVEVSLKDNAVPNAYFEFVSDNQKMGYYKPLIGDVKQYLPFLAGLKIYDYNGQNAYLCFDGDSDFNKIASVTITGYTSNEAYIEVKLTDGGVINTKFLARADSGGGSTYTGTIKTSNNTIYFVNDGGTSNKDATTTAAYWYVDYYKFTGNNGVAIQSAQQTFNSTGSSASTPSGSFSTTIKYTVTYDANDGDCGQTTGYATSVSAAVTLPTPRRSGYMFVGWYTAASGGTRIGGAGDSYTPTANITLYAQWGKPSTVTYNANGGVCDKETEQFTGTALILPTPTKDGYWFNGWYTEASGGTKAGDAGAVYSPTGDITLYAQWSSIYTVTYNANGGSVTPASSKYEGVTLTLPMPTRDGYAFNGWYTAASGGTKVGAAGASYTPNKNITLYAQWKEPIIVTYGANGGSCGTSSQTYTGAALTLPMPTRSGYHFTGWYTAASGGTKVGDAGASYTPTANITLYAQWTGYVVTYDANNGSCSTASQTYAGTALILPTATRNNYTFNGWYTATSGGTKIGAAGASYTPTADITLYAQWTYSGGCVTPDTLVTLSNGTQKRIDEITYADEFIVWDFVKGEYTTTSAAIIDNHGYSLYTVTTLVFEDGTVIKTIDGHGFYHKNTNEFIMISYINVADYVGHEFLKEDMKTLVRLVDYSVTTEEVESWSILTAEHYNAMLNGMFTLTPGQVQGSEKYLMPFQVSQDLKYDEEARQADIEKYGLYIYEDFEEYVTREQFDALNLSIFKVSVGKGYITYEEIIFLLKLHCK